MAAPRTYYEILDIPSDAPAADVEAGYQRALEAFSDTGLASYALFTPDEAADVRREIETAYRVLKDAARRSQYDAELAGAGDKAAATLTFTARFVQATSESSSVSDGTPPPALPTAEPPARRTEPRLQAVVIAPAVEEVREPAARPEPAPDLPALPPPAATVAPEIPSSVPVSLGPTDPPAPPPTPSQPAPPRFRRVSADDGTTALQLARAVRPPSTLPTPVATTEQGGPALQLPEDGEINGALLQRLRESRGISVRELSEVTKISVHYLKAMEANQFNELPTRVYLRGFLVHYARAMGVNSERLAKGYLAFADRFRNNLS